MTNLPLEFSGQSFLAHPSGALIWPAQEALLVADLHLEKASAFAKAGQFLPPYDSLQTIAKLEALVASTGMKKLLSLGDSFQDAEASKRLPNDLVQGLEELHDRCPLTWIKGNHDPVVEGVPGDFIDDLSVAGISLQHEPCPQSEDDCAPQIFGHLHPKVLINGRGKSFSKPCFVQGKARLILPAFGVFVGGLRVSDPAIRSLFTNEPSYLALGKSAVHPVASSLPKKRFASA